MVLFCANRGGGCKGAKVEENMEKSAADYRYESFLRLWVDGAAELWYNMDTQCGKGLGLRVSRG